MPGLHMRACGTQSGNGSASPHLRGHRSSAASRGQRAVPRSQACRCGQDALRVVGAGALHAALCWGLQGGPPVARGGKSRVHLKLRGGGVGSTCNRRKSRREAGEKLRWAGQVRGYLLGNRAAGQGAWEGSTIVEGEAVGSNAGRRGWRGLCRRGEHRSRLRDAELELTVVGEGKLEVRMGDRAGAMTEGDGARGRRRHGQTGHCRW